MNKDKLDFISRALNAAVEKADDTKKWVAGIPQSEAWLAITAKAIKEFEESLLKLFIKQRNRYLKKIKANVKKADDGIKDAKEELAAIREEYEKLFEDKVNKSFMDIVNQIAREVLNVAGKEGNYADIKFDLINDNSKAWLKNKRIKFAREVSETTHKAVIDSLSEGFKAGEGIKDLKNRIKELPEFSANRARLVARTEVIASSNAGTFEGYLQSGVVAGMEWLATADGRTRPTHSAANSQKKKLGEPFVVSGYKMLFPGDSSLGAPAKEVIQCRCTIIPVLDESELGGKKNAK